MIDQATIDALRGEVIGEQKMFIDGDWTESQSGARDNAVSPIDGQVLTQVAAADRTDVDRAVAAARKSFESGIWSRCEPAFRKKVLHRIGDLIEKHANRLAVLGVRDNGTEMQMAFGAEPGSSAGTFHYSAECVDKLYGEIAPTSDKILGLIHHDPVGVVGVIVPWNTPLMITAWKIGAALAVGNSVVLKPSEDACLNVLALTQLCAEAGLPEGVLNVVTGSGEVVGDAIARHMDVDVVAFTGSGRVGRALLEASAQSNMKRIYLELGGKSPNIVFADAPDLDKAAMVSAKGFFKNSGQICVAPSRLIVEDSIKEEFVARIVEHAKSIRVGDPLDLDTQMGAINNPRQLKTVQNFVAAASKEGGEILCGGEQILLETGGTYFQPTVVDGVGPDDTLFRQEVFGPVLGVTGFKTEAEAIELANATDYGLAGVIWTQNISRAHRMIGAVNSGVIQVNSMGRIGNEAPMGGFKQSGNGVDKSLHAFDKFINLKTAWVHL
ncbi:MAG: aldehyde dehydrogenase family protein [Rhizobiaceae bacterium]